MSLPVAVRRACAVAVHHALAFFALAVFAVISLPADVAAQQGSFTLAQVKSAPFPSELTAAPTGARIAWVFDEQGVRNVYGRRGS
ncbi:MAG: hypothetical protein P8174_11605 [Gemmatimonadota bacterium]